jgi:membrane-associated phospholipid phosphatase
MEVRRLSGGFAGYSPAILARQQVVRDIGPLLTALVRTIEAVPGARRLHLLLAQVVLALSIVMALSVRPSASIGGGIDRVINFDQSGIWNRNVQKGIEYGSIAAELAGALWYGGDDRLGKTFWQSIDSSVLGGISSEAMKHIFTRSWPDQGGDPNQWFQGSGHYSFPSGEVTLVTAVVTPFMFEYGHDHPGVYALALLPAYDAIARVKSQAHWQTDVLASIGLGTVTGYLAHSRDSPLILGLLPQGFMVGLHTRF